jgi:D-apionolactonase
MNDRPLGLRKLTTYELWYGRDEPPPPQTCLRAGPLTAIWEGGDLRSIRLGDSELLRRVYVAVRDENWDTIAAYLTNVSAEVRPDRFAISYDAKNSSRNLELQWHATITGEPNGTITLAMDGQATRDFLYCRIGFCLLHPLAEYCGQPYRGNCPDGLVSGNLPTLIAPQRYERGFYLPLFPPASSFMISLKGGVRVSLAFEGDLFEMEDQRNWTDGSFKTYCTPLSLGYPHQAHAGQKFKQRVTLTVQASAPQGDVNGSKVRVDVGPPLQRTLPRIGLGVASHEEDLSPQDAALLGRLHLDHLRADVHLCRDDVDRQLTRAERECGQLNCALELALFLTGDADKELQSLFCRLPLSVPVSRVFVFHEKETTTSRTLIKVAREVLAPYLPQGLIGGGTDLYFAELNRSRPDVTAFDAIAFSINPQVHSFDERSLVENLQGQADTVKTAQAFCGSRSISVSPITLKPRFNPDAAGPEPPPLPGELPSAVDARQMSLFAAAWTLGSVKQLTSAGVASLTFYETTGWRGVKEINRGSLLPNVFRSFPNMVFPVYHVFADLADLKEGELIACSSSDPLRIQALAVLTRESLQILIANLTAEPQECAVGPLAGAHVRTRTLSAITAPLATTHPQEFRSEAKLEIPVRDLTLTLALQAYSVVRIDAAFVAI